MDLNPGKSVYLNHYSGRDPIVSTIIETEEQFVRVQLIKNFANIRLKVSDPIVLSYEDEKSLFTCEGYVSEISSGAMVVQIRIDNVQAMNNNRVFERFPVSLYASVRMSGHKKRVAVIKNISLSGMAITTKQEMKIGHHFEGEIFMDERLINFTGEVAWKNNDGLRYEYGIKTSYPDYIVKNTVRLYLTLLQQDHERYAKDEFNLIINSKISEE